MVHSYDNEYMPHFESFDSIWKGGYFEGDPLDPLGQSKYRRIGYISVLFAVYTMCIKPYIDYDTIALEIGPGRGAWTKCMLKSKEIWCLDAKSREDNHIDEYLGHPQNLVYHQVTDFSCNVLPDDTFSYMFSFGCLCHVPWEGIQLYANNIFPKLKSGAEAFWMIADYDKRNKLARNFQHFDIINRTLPLRIFKILEWVNKLRKGKILGPSTEPLLNKDDENQKSEKGRWYHSGKERTSEMLKKTGYVILSSDMDIVPRDVIIHFRKP